MTNGRWKTMGPLTAASLAAASLAAASLAAGCGTRCGEYAYQTGVVWDIPGDDDAPESLDDYTLHEACGTMAGSIAYRDLLGDGVGYLRLDGTHPNSHVAIALTSAMFLDVYFPSALVDVGTTLTTADIVETSSAYVISNEVEAGAFLTRAEIELLDVRYDDFWDTDAYRMRFDVTYGEPGVSEFWYTAVGEDWVAMM